MSDEEGQGIKIKGRLGNRVGVGCCPQQVS